MIDKTAQELLAISKALDYGSEYTQELGISDLALLDYDQAMGLCEAIITGYLEGIGRG